jgi:hypothetical protein
MSLARRLEAEIYAITNSARRAVVTIGDCVRQHVADKRDQWKDRVKRICVLRKWGPEYAERDDTELRHWSVHLVGYMRAKKDDRTRQTLRQRSL